MVNIFFSGLIVQYQEKILKFFHDLNTKYFIAQVGKESSFVLQISVLDNTPLFSVSEFKTKLDAFVWNEKIFHHGFYIHNGGSGCFSLSNISYLEKKKASNSTAKPQSSKIESETPEQEIAVTNFKVIQPLLKFIDDLN